MLHAKLCKILIILGVYKTIIMRVKVISGGQTGVDRAALDAAIKANIECAGFCPKGRLAEDGKINVKYPLIETQSSFYQERTRKNVDVSDAVLILNFNDIITGGTALCRDYAKKCKKPIFYLNISSVSIKQNVYDTLKWIQSNNIVVINIVGNRESSQIGIYTKSMEFLTHLFTAM